MAYTTYTGAGVGASSNLTASTVTIPSGGYITGSTSVTLNNPGHTHAWTSITANSVDPSVNITSDGITMREETDIVIGGVSLKKFIEDVNRRLGIMVPNPKLEKDFEQLKELRDRYEELEKKLVEQAKVWDTLKKE